MRRCVRACVRVCGYVVACMCPHGLASVCIFTQGRFYKLVGVCVCMCACARVARLAST